VHFHHQFNKFFFSHTFSGFSAQQFPNLIVADTKICDLCLMQLQIAYVFRDTTSKASAKLEQQLASIYKTMIVDDGIASTSTENYYESRIDDYVEPITDIRPLPVVSFEPFLKSSVTTTTNQLHTATTIVEIDDEDDDCVFVDDLGSGNKELSNSQTGFSAVSNSVQHHVPENDYSYSTDMIKSCSSIKILQSTHDGIIVGSHPFENNIQMNATIQHKDNVSPETSNQPVNHGFYLNNTSVLPETANGTRLISIRKLDNTNITVPAELESQVSWNINTIKKCEICCIFFKSDADLSNHHAKEHSIHSGEHHVLKEYNCGHCTLKFPSHAELKKHKRKSHRYHCKKCNLRFAGRAQFEKHLDRHEDKIGPFACPVCRKRFKLPRNLYVHKAYAHQIYECLRCLLLFKSKDELKLHNEVKHPMADQKTKAKVKEYDCETCSQIFTHPLSLRKHNILCHHHECGKCRAVFKSYSLLRSHKASQHPPEPVHRKEINNEQYEPEEEAEDDIEEEEDDTETFEIEIGQWLKSES
jgi:hypothetical protein